MPNKISDEELKRWLTRQVRKLDEILLETEARMTVLEAFADPDRAGEELTLVGAGKADLAHLIIGRLQGANAVMGEPLAQTAKRLGVDLRRGR